MAGTINGREYQLATMNVKFAIPGAAPIAINSFSKATWKETVKHKPVYDHQGQIVNYTTDKKETEGSITMKLSEFIAALVPALQAAGAAAGGRGIGEIAFDATFTYGNSQATLVTRRLVGCMIDSHGADASDDQEAIPTEVPLFYTTVTDGSGNPILVNYNAPLQP